MLCVLIRGDSKDNIEAILMITLNSIYHFQYRIENQPKSAAMGFFPKGLNNDFETIVVNEPSVFEPLQFYCSTGSCLF